MSRFFLIFFFILMSATVSNFSQNGKQETSQKKTFKEILAPH